MKKYFLIISMVIVGGFLKAQINLEHTYSISGNRSISLVNLGDSVYNYLLLDKHNWRYTLYHMNHSVNISDTLPGKGNESASTFVLYFTRSLFDCDTSNIEFLISNFFENIGNGYVSIYRTDGTCLFHRDNARMWITSTTDNSYNGGVVKTPAGTKMFLLLMNGSVEVYNLCGTLPTGMSINKPDGYNGLSYPVPNPAINYTRIDYKLPDDVNSGELVFYDTRGIEVKRFKVDHNFTNLQLNTSDLRSGTYYYNLQVAGKATEGKKLVVIK